jgi:hypothetical protein
MGGMRAPEKAPSRADRVKFRRRAVLQGTGDAERAAAERLLARFVAAAILGKEMPRSLRVTAPHGQAWHHA